MRIGTNLSSLLLLTFALLLTNACGQSQADKTAKINEYEAKAKELRIKKDFRGALEYQQKAVKLNLTDNAIYNYLDFSLQ